MRQQRTLSVCGWIAVVCLGLLSACRQDVGSRQEPLFVEVAKESGIDFVNQLSFDSDFNIYTYRNFYNGGGVALGDVNNDGLLDVYFTANMSGNKLYLNKGNFQFEDITQKAGVAGTKAWSTGVSMADVNGDGFVDIYICNSGDVKGDNKQNELFINNGDLTFSEKAEEYGVADRGFSTHAAFFDFDRDGDLDLYILNNSYQAIGSFNLRKNERPKRDPMGGHKLLRNDNNHFIDVSEQAGIYGSTIAFGLGVTVGDINKDGWPDIYVSNDFFERDYLYINAKNGTFKECLPDQMRSISGASMGADLADINNDTYPDIFVTEMLPRENKRIKTVTTFENWDRYQYGVSNDYFHQFTRNMLQLNNGDGTFSEIGRLAGVEATDWSWGALMFDMDNDGLRDIFVANGIYQDLTNQDFLQFISNEEIVNSIVDGNKVDYKKLVSYIPSEAVPNFAFRNEGALSFKDKAQEWGLSYPDFSNGSAYGDLDNDGDLDLVVNNVNSRSFVFRNDATRLLPANKYLRFELAGAGANTDAFGTKITVVHNGHRFYVEQMPIRGFESTMDARPHIGLGKIDTVDQVIVDWPDGTQTLLTSVGTNQVLKLNQQDGKMNNNRETPASPVPLLTENPTVIDFVQLENEFVDFDRDRLIYHMVSTEGPRMSKGDINGDGLEDFYIGGPKGQAGALFVQRSNGTFMRTNQSLLEKEKGSEDMGSVFFDADNDGDQDLYVATGGNEFSGSSVELMDKLFLNDGHGTLTLARKPPIAHFESTSVVLANDFDNDGDTDLFVGGRLQPFAYGLPANGYLLVNDGRGQFKDVTKEMAPSLLECGMITDALFADVDGDRDADLIVVGEYMPVKILINEKGRFQDNTVGSGLDHSNGWWNRIKAADLDGDGDLDFVIGNHGLNSRFRASVDKPVCLYVSDFDQNGTIEQITCTFEGNKNYPMVLRHELVTNIPVLKKKYLKYENYKDQTIEDVFGADALKRAYALKAYQLASCIVINQGNGKFDLKPLPPEAQLAPVFGIDIYDLDDDGHLDILLGGNLYGAKPEVGRYDASFGVVLKGDGRGNFSPLAPEISGLKIDGEIRDMLTLKQNGGELIIVSRNSAGVVTLKRRHP